MRDINTDADARRASSADVCARFVELPSEAALFQTCGLNRRQVLILIFCSCLKALCSPSSVPQNLETFFLSPIRFNQEKEKDFHCFVDFQKIHAKLKPVAGFFQLYPPAKSSLNCFLTERLSVPEESATVTFSRLRLPICSINSQFLLGKQTPPSGV